MAKHVEPSEEGVRGDVEVIVSEERLQAGTRTVPTGRARLQRVVVTERKTIEVEVRHEEIRVVHDEGPEFGELVVEDLRAQETPWVTLRQERFELVSHLEPVERVRLVVDRVAGEEPVTATLRHEVVDVVGVDAEGDSRPLGR